MQQLPERPIKGRSWGVPASAAAHLLVIALLIFGLPLPEFDREEPEAIAVEIVPPPELEEAGGQEGQTKEEQAEEEQAEEEQAEEVETEEAEAEAAKAEENQAEDEQAEEQAAEEEAAEEEETAEASPPESETENEEQANAPPPIPVLRPVFEFGEEDAGPRETTEGSASTEADIPAEELLPEPEEAQPQAETAEAFPEPLEEMAEARTLYSERLTGGAFATSAIAGMPRDIRAGELCATELREQLRRATPPYWPDLLPSYRLPAGTVMQVDRGAFRASGQWFDLRFRCEVDGEVTRVVAFAFDVGAAIPRDRWRARGFPDF